MMRQAGAALVTASSSRLRRDLLDDHAQQLEVERFLKIMSDAVLLRFLTQPADRGYQNDPQVRLKGVGLLQEVLERHPRKIVVEHKHFNLGTHC